MADIRYVCLSDMHLGEEDSLLTNLKTASTNVDPLQPSPVMQQLVKCLGALISKNEDQSKKPTLILNGDILELALATTDQAAMVFESFVRLIMPSKSDKRLFDKIIYIPGNHDHHLWEMARETQYVNHIISIPPGNDLPTPYHTTNMFMEDHPKPVISYFLTNLIRRSKHLQGDSIAIAYPNFGLRKDVGNKYVIFHHGHFIEPLYQAMSTFRGFIFPDRDKPRDVWELEAENFAWIDFFWSAMGRSGGAGQDIELIYEKIHDKKQLKKLLSNLAASLAEEYDLPGWGDRMESALLRGALHAAADKIMGRERSQTKGFLSEDAQKGFWTYVNGPIREQLDTELKHGKLSDVTIVFGHTHKPYAEDATFKKYPDWVNVYNTGGWVVESVEPEPLRGGAVILVDEDLNTVSLRMFNESENPDNYSVKVEEARHSGEKESPLYKRISNLVAPDKQPWKGFSAAVARSVRVRAQNLRARINEAD